MRKRFSKDFRLLLDSMVATDNPADIINKPFITTYLQQQYPEEKITTNLVGAFTDEVIQRFNDTFVFEEESQVRVNKNNYRGLKFKGKMLKRYLQFRTLFNQFKKKKRDTYKPSHKKEQSQEEYSEQEEEQDSNQDQQQNQESHILRCEQNQPIISNERKRQQQDIIDKIKRQYEEKIKLEKDQLQLQIQSMKQVYEKKMNQQKVHFERQIADMKDQHKQSIKKQTQFYEERIRNQKGSFEAKMNEQQQIYVQKLKNYRTGQVPEKSLPPHTERMVQFEKYQVLLMDLFVEILKKTNLQKKHLPLGSYNQLIQNLLNPELFPEIVQAYRQNRSGFEGDVKTLFIRLIKIRNFWAHQKHKVTCQYIVQCYQTLDQIISMLRLDGKSFEKIQQAIKMRKISYYQLSMIEAKKELKQLK